MAATEKKHSEKKHPEEITPEKKTSRKDISSNPISPNQKKHPSRFSRRILIRRPANPVSYRLTREGWQVCFMIGFVILGAILRDVNLLILLAGALLALLIIQWRVAIKTIQRIGAHRHFPRSMQAKKPFDVELTISNPKSWLGAWWVNAEERLMYETSSPSEVAQPQIFQSINLLFPSIPPETSRTLKYRCEVAKRGRYRFLPTEISSRFPLGLLRSILKSSNPDSILIHPATGTLTTNWKELFRGRRTGTHESSSRTLSDQGEFFGLRSYHPGDSPRWIHWRSTARRNELMVKQYQQASSQELVLLLDLHCPQSISSTSSGVEQGQQVSPTKTELAQQSLEQTEKYNAIEETCVEFAASIATYIANSTSTILTLGLADREPTIASKLQTRGQAMAVLDRLATAHSGITAKDEPASSLACTLELLEREFRRVDNLVVVSTRSQASAMQGELQSPDGKLILPFWNQLTWIDASQGELSPYFKPTPFESSTRAKE